jgi:beta-glucosidase
MAREYILGMQGEQLGTDSVVAVVKHWVGYPASPDGYDGHNYYGKDSIVTAEQLPLHVQPFAAAFAAGAAGVMPTYSVLKNLELDGRSIEPVGGGFSRELIEGLLRGQQRFGGFVLSDWGITNDCDQSCRTGEPPQGPRSIATSWGVESLSKVERFAKGVNAGLDQFGGTTESQYLLEAVEGGQVSLERLDSSVGRILEMKFVLGLFERPFVDPTRAATIVGSATANATALAAQHRSLVLLENGQRLLPLGAGGKRVFLHGIDPAMATARGFTPVDNLDEAELALVRVTTPFETLHPGFFFGSRHHEGRLDFRDGQPDFELIDRASRVPTILVVHLDRPAILTAVRGKVAALVGDFGISDAALFDVLQGRASPQGKLPFALPASMEQVEAQSPALPHDIVEPLYRFGYGQTYQP